MALQVLGVEVRLGTVWARVLAISIHTMNDGLFATSSWNRRSTSSARQDSTATLRSDNASRLGSIIYDVVEWHK